MSAADLRAALAQIAGSPGGTTGALLTAAGPALGVAAIAGVAPISTRGGGLVETDYAARELYPEQTLWSADGLFSLSFAPVKKVGLTDENGNAVPLTLARPA